MKKFLILLLKPLSFLPALAIMYMIFSFSGQTGAVSSNISYKVSHKIVTVGSDLLGKDFSEDQIEFYVDKIHGPVRKLAHMTEYFILAVAVSFPLYVYNLRGIPLMIVAGAICVAFACGDEYHQSFVEGRGPSKRDVMIDSVGVFFGIILVRIVCWVFLAPSRMRKARRRKKRAR
ncbi:VanZ family protein [Lactonifactor longoviformis]|uniref:VanZ family protein n=1 Tax=Lactonifactor longoviformis TaxID=341220 RepID=UPI0036F33080